jgi:hypothetical protein
MIKERMTAASGGRGRYSSTFAATSALVMAMLGLVTIAELHSTSVQTRHALRISNGNMEVRRLPGPSEDGAEVKPAPLVPPGSETLKAAEAYTRALGVPLVPGDDQAAQAKGLEPAKDQSGARSSSKAQKTGPAVAHARNLTAVREVRYRCRTSCSDTKLVILQVRLVVLRTLLLGKSRALQA